MSSSSAPAWLGCSAGCAGSRAIAPRSVGQHNPVAAIQCFLQAAIFPESASTSCSTRRVTCRFFARRWLIENSPWAKIPRLSAHRFSLANWSSAHVLCACGMEAKSLRLVSDETQAWVFSGIAMTPYSNIAFHGHWLRVKSVCLPKCHLERIQYQVSVGCVGPPSVALPPTVNAGGVGDITCIWCGA